MLTGNPADTLATLWEDKAFSNAGPFWARPNLLKELYNWRMRDEVTNYGDKPDMVLSATFSGPVPFIDNTTFFSSYRREKDYYLYPGVRDHFFDQNGMFKITTRPNSSMKFSFTSRYTETTGLNRYDYYLYDKTVIQSISSDRIVRLKHSHESMGCACPRGVPDGYSSCSSPRDPKRVSGNLFVQGGVTKKKEAYRKSQMSNEECLTGKGMKDEKETSSHSGVGVPSSSAA